MGLLWFRKSRGSAKHPDPVSQPVVDSVEAAAVSRQLPAPLRIRGLLLLTLKPTDGAADIERAPCLGSRERVIEMIREIMPGIGFAEGVGKLESEGHRLTLDLGPHDPVHAIVAEAEGDPGIELLRALLERTRWRAYVPRTGVFIEPDAIEIFALPDL
jgi:hypothetical protein